jgi:hypothetical protein
MIAGGGWTLEDWFENTGWSTSLKPLEPTLNFPIVKLSKIDT